MDIDNIIEIIGIVVAIIDIVVKTIQITITLREKSR
jgi:hypothetical protein